jgi:oligopeptidase B
MPVKPPAAARRPHRLSLHGRAREDPYYWLRAENWQQVMREPKLLAPDIRAFLEAWNAYTDEALADTKALQKMLFAEMKGRIKEDDASVPLPDGPYAYYWRFETGGQHEVYCRRPCGREMQGEEVLLHGDREAEGLSYFHVGSFEHSPDHRFAAYAVDKNGAEYFTLRVRDLSSGADLPEIIRDAHGDIAWSADGRAFLYTRLDAHHRPSKVFRHRLGSDPADDRLVYEEKDPTQYLSVSSTLSRRFVVIAAHDHESSELRLLKSDRLDAVPLLVAAREPRHEYSLADHGEVFFILTNADGAEDFKLAIAPVEDPSRARWRDFLTHESGRLLVSFIVFKHHLVRLERVDALPRIVVTALGEDHSAGAEHTVSFDEEAYSLSVTPGYEYDTACLRFVYSSPATPQQTFDYDLATRERRLRKVQEVPSGHDPAHYAVHRLLAPADDGEEVPVTVLTRKDFERGKGAPLLLYGYGAYGFAIPSGFSTTRLSLVDRGIAYAIAHIRGGRDKGHHWYHDGKLAKKKNTFTDYIAAARHLAREGFAREGEILAHGGSAGGLLMGAVANMAPALFRAVVAEVPFVDILTTMCDATLPLTPPEWSEWGNPIEDESVFDYIASYSPYDNVRSACYPHILALAGLTDPRVTYWEPAKWIAKLAALKTGGNLLLLRTNMEAGHGGAPGRFDRLEEVALVYAFMLKVCGRAS